MLICFGKYESLSFVSTVFRLVMQCLTDLWSMPRRSSESGVFKQNLACTEVKMAALVVVNWENHFRGTFYR